MNKILDKIFYGLFQTKNDVGVVEKFVVTIAIFTILLSGITLVLNAN